MARKTPSRSGPTMMLAAISAMGLGGLGYYVQSTPEARTVPKNERRAEPESTTPPEVKREPKKRRSVRQKPADTVYAVRVLNGKVTLVALSEEPPAGVGPEVFALTRTIRNLETPGVRVLGVSRAGRVAKIDFNAAVEGGMGSMEESQFLEGIQRTMGQFSGIRTLTLSVEGRRLETLGHIAIDSEIPVLRAGEEAAQPTEESEPPADGPETPRSVPPR